MSCLSPSTPKTISTPARHQSMVWNSENVKKKFKRMRRRHSSALRRGSVKPLLLENQKLRQEMEVMENQLSEYQAQMPSVFDELEEKADEISYLRSALESSQKKCQILHEQQRKMEMKMIWKTEDIQEELSKISDESNAEIESIKDRLLKQVSQISQELSLEIHERNVLVNDLVIVKKQLTKLRKDKDDEREAYLYTIAELESACRAVIKEKNKYRVDIEDMREQVYTLHSELEKQRGLVAEKEQLVETLREELFRLENTECVSDKASTSRSVVPGNLAVELMVNENLIAELRDENSNMVDELAEGREHLENVLEIMEYAVSAITPTSESGDGLYRIEKAIEDTRDYLGLQPIDESETDDTRMLISPAVCNDEPAPENENFFVGRKEMGTIRSDNLGLEEVPGKQEKKSLNDFPKSKLVPSNLEKIEEFKQEVFKEVAKLKEDILEEFKQLNQDTLRVSFVEEQLMDTTQTSAQDSQKTDRITAWDTESSKELQRLAVVSWPCLEWEKEKNNEFIEWLKKTMFTLEAELGNANSKIESLRKELQKNADERLGLKFGTESKQNYNPSNIKLSKFRKIATPERDTRDSVTAFFVTYSKVSSWAAFKDPNFRKTSYMFQFHGLMWKARISFLHPFVKYMAQVIGVNKRYMESLLTMVPTSTGGIKINNIASAFKLIRESLETRSTNNLYRYIFIYLKNVATHYRYTNKSRSPARYVHTKEKPGRAVRQLPKRTRPRLKGKQISPGKMEIALPTEKFSGLGTWM